MTTSSITRLHKSARMSKIVMHGDMIYLCGQVGSGDDIKAQTADMLGRVDALLAEAGSNKSNILSATLWISNMDNFAEMNEVYEAWIDPENPPARACGEARLARDALLVEIIITAVKA
ncbi:MAG: RidA family protein [Kordiimonadaceae bacterium]|jgi:enamine deaminase RidA (YjgF/YER057c/UK114 family)|nr:RidA family protein [Kordiimonadaceae bacterium]MBT6032000.1 RidA family protein [Kordiimonadaceae bacterium]